MTFLIPVTEILVHKRGFGTACEKLVMYSACDKLKCDALSLMALT